MSLPKGFVGEYSQPDLTKGEECMVKIYRDLGWYTEDQIIRKILRARGWTKEKIDEAFENLEKNESKENKEDEEKNKETK